MKVQLIVVQGKPEGKTIPLLGPRFKIGRGETCHLRPNSELVSREHAEFSVTADTLSVQDLGSRNGTLVNGKALTGPAVLKNGDLVQVGPLTFAVSIQGVPESTVKPVAAPTPAAAKAAPAASSLDEASNDDIDSWLVDENAAPAPDKGSSVYGGDTITISAFRDAANASKANAAAAEDNDEEYERVSDEESSELESSGDEDDDEEESADDMPEEFIDESNPFYVKKKPGEEPAKPGKQVYTDTSDAAKDILSKILERRRNASNSK